MISIQIECPHCHRGYAEQISSTGWLRGPCRHCGQVFFSRITIAGIKVETATELPAAATNSEPPAALTRIAELEQENTRLRNMLVERVERILETNKAVRLM